MKVKPSYLKVKQWQGQTIKKDTFLNSRNKSQNRVAFWVRHTKIFGDNCHKSWMMLLYPRLKDVTLQLCWQDADKRAVEPLLFSELVGSQFQLNHSWQQPDLAQAYIQTPWAAKANSQPEGKSISFTVTCALLPNTMTMPSLIFSQRSNKHNKVFLLD